MNNILQHFLEIIKTDSFIKNLKRTGAVLLTLCIIFVGYKSASKILRNNDSQVHYIPFKKNKTDYDVYFLGSSHMVDGIFPMQLWNDYGIKSYNLAYDLCFIHVNYGILRLAIKHKKPKIVVLDTYRAYNEYNISTNSFAHKAFDAFPFTISKLLILNDIFKNSKKKINIPELIVPFSLYHSRWSDSKAKFSNLFNTSLNRQMGAELKSTVYSEDILKPISKNKHYNPNDNAMNPIKKIADFCKKNDIKLVLCYLPFTANNYNQMTANTVALFAEEYQIPYINFLDLNIVNYSTDFFDESRKGDNQHLNASGARKVTDYLGKYLKEHYSLEDYRQNTNYSENWNNWYADYKEFLKENIRKQTNFKSILMLLNNSNFTGKLTYSDRYQFDKTEKELLAQITKTCPTKKVSYKKNANLDVILEIFDSKTKEKVHRMVYRKNNKGVLTVFNEEENNKAIAEARKQYEKTLRIDIKNKGSKENAIEILKSNLETKFTSPKWFTNNEGTGQTVETNKLTATFTLKCKNNGTLKINFLGHDWSDKKNLRTPLKIDITKCQINGENIIDKTKTVWHDAPLKWQKDVMDEETVTVHVEWGLLTKIDR